MHARTILLENVLDQIRGTEPDLTDHGPEHIHNVLCNVSDLLNETPDYFTPLELYVLGLGVLFHDVGNLEGRLDHNRRISQFYDLVRPNHDRPQEKSLVVQICKAHSGTNDADSRNTLEDVPTSEHLDGKPIRAREIAAIVRFADELAEGPQRTSQYLCAIHGYSADSMPFHLYAAATNVCIDPGNERIAVTYHFHLDAKKDLEEQLASLECLLGLVHDRLAKLNAERRYARFHCPEPLLPFRAISVRINVQLDGQFLDLDLATTISDGVDLDRSPELLSDRDDRWTPPAILELIRQHTQREANP